MTTTLGLFRHSADAKEYRAGEIIFRQGDEAHSMYVVAEGAVDIVIGDMVVDTLADGGIFGELALIDKTPRSATAVAKTDARIVPIDERRFMFLLQQTPNFALQVMRVMAERLKRRDPALRTTKI